MIPLSNSIINVLLRASINSAPLEAMPRGGKKELDRFDILSLLGSVRRTNPSADVGTQVLLHCIADQPCNAALGEYLASNCSKHSPLWEDNMELRIRLLRHFAFQAMAVFIVGNARQKCGACKGSGIEVVLEQGDYHVSHCKPCGGEGKVTKDNRMTTARMLKQVTILADTDLSKFNIPFTLTRYNIDKHAMPVYGQVKDMLIDACTTSVRHLERKLWKESVLEN